MYSSNPAILDVISMVSVLQIMSKLPELLYKTHVILNCKKKNILECVTPDGLCGYP